MMVPGDFGNVQREEIRSYPKLGKREGICSMKEHRKKMIAPVVITGIFVLYFLGLIALYLCIDGIPGWVKVLLVVIPLALAGVMIGALCSRIKEIRSGEEDDLSKY